MIIYQIYPRSFFDSSGDGVGDLQGISAKLPYLAKLGVEMLWISPFFQSPMKDFGYDVSDYCAIDPLFGTMEDFDQLMAKCQELGLRVMIDMVLSHSSDQHPWFLESKKSRNNPKADWFVWADAKEGQNPNNWLSIFGGTAWQWEESRQQYYFHNFLREQPDLNFHQPAVRKALLDSCEFWLKKGVSGIRLDVCNFYYHSEGLENNPERAKNTKDAEGIQYDKNPYNFQKHIYDKDRPENLGFLRELRALADRYPETTLMGEVVSDDSLGMMGQYIAGKEHLHTAYNFSLFKEGFDGLYFAEVLSAFEKNIPHGIPTWALNNHDVKRFVSRFHADAQWPQSAKCFLFFLFCLRGNIILYQGDELGLDEAEIPREALQDPFGIAFYPEFKGRDGCRTPMPWTNTLLEGQSWLPISETHLPRAVSLQEGNSDSVLNFVKTLVQFRKERPWLTKSPLKVLQASKDTLLLQRWENPSQRFLAAINGSARKQSIAVGGIGSMELAPYTCRAWTVNEAGEAKALDF